MKKRVLYILPHGTYQCPYCNELFQWFNDYGDDEVICTGCNAKLTALAWIKILDETEEDD